jgi:hypothetical protein
MSGMSALTSRAMCSKEYGISGGKKSQLQVKEDMNPAIT